MSTRVTFAAQSATVCNTMTRLLDPVEVPAWVLCMALVIPVGYVAASALLARELRRL